MLNAIGCGIVDGEKCFSITPRCPFKKCSLYCSPEFLHHPTIESEFLSAVFGTGVFLLIPASH